MFMDGGNEMPEGDWVNTEEAAALWSRAMGRTITKATIQRWLREQDQRVGEFRIWRPTREYLIDRQSMLDSFERSAQRLTEVVQEERAKTEGGEA